MSCTKKNPLFSCCHLSTCVWVTFTLLKQLFSYENHPTAKTGSSFQITFLSCPPPKRDFCPFKTLKYSYLKPLLKSVCINLDESSANSASYNTKPVSSLIQHRNIKKRITCSLTASPLSSRQNCLKNNEHSSMRISLFFYWIHLIKTKVVHSDCHRSLNSLGNDSYEVEEIQQHMKNTILNGYYQIISAVTPDQAIG